MAFARINGVLLHYHWHGPEGAPVLALVNSLGTDARIWDDMIALLAGRYRVLSYDKRGHGLSDVPDGDYALDDHLDDLSGLLGHLGIARLALCGVSVGGLIAQGFALRDPARLSALILCDTAPHIGSAALWNERIAAVRAGGMEALADAVMERWFPADVRRERADEVAGWRNLFLRNPVAGYVGTCATLRDTDLREKVAAISVPTLVVVGEHDASTPVDLVRDAAGRIPGARFEIVAGAGHIPSIDQPDALAALVLGFVQETGHGCKSRYEQGMSVRRAVLGDAHVDAASARMTAFDEDFQSFITEGAWGSVWSRPELSRRERSMLTLALLAALGQDEEFAMHVRATVNTGASPQDIKEALLHVAVYAGVPAANHAFKIAKQELAKQEAAKAEGKPE